jgi:hypothetical protein
MPRDTLPLVLGCFFALLAACMVVIHMASGPTELVARRFSRMAAAPEEPGAGLGLGIKAQSTLLATRQQARAGKGASGRKLPDFVVSGGGDDGGVNQGGASTADATADAQVGWAKGTAKLVEAAAAEGQAEEGVDNVPAAGDQVTNEEGSDEKAEEEEGGESGEEEEQQQQEGKSGASYNPYGFLAGDPILNQNVQSGTYVDPCEKTLNCPTAENEEKNAKWRSIKQVRLGASELMERQLVQVLLKMQRRAEECEKGFADDEAKMAKCTQDHLQRACDKYGTFLMKKSSFHFSLANAVSSFPSCVVSLSLSLSSSVLTLFVFIGVLSLFCG